MVREPDATMQPTLQDNQLMSKHRVLGFKPQLRLEWRGQDGQNETKQPDHSASLGDSITSSTRIRFSVHTGLTSQQVLRSLVLMRVKNWDYRELRERIADGYTLRQFTDFHSRLVPRHDAFHRGPSAAAVIDERLNLVALLRALERLREQVRKAELARSPRVDRRKRARIRWLELRRRLCRR